MSTHSKIVLSRVDNHQYKEGIISGTPSPGTVMQISAGVEPIGGKHTWVAYNRDADGDRPLGPLVVLCENWKLGKTTSDAYVSGEYGIMFVPYPGDELQVLLQNQSGTSDSFAIGDLLMVDDGTGKAIATSGSIESEPWVVMETLAAITVDTLCHVMYTGY